MRSSHWRARIAIAVVVVALVELSLPGGRLLGTTLASWTDQAFANGTFESNTWAITGASSARTVDTAAELTVLGTATIDQALTSAVANPGSPGPNTNTAAALDLTAGLLGLSIDATNASSLASYAPTNAAATAQFDTATISLDLLTLVTLANLLVVSASSGAVTADVACPVPGTGAATLTPYSALVLSVLGVGVDATLAGGGGVTVNVGIGLLNVRVVITLGRLTTTTATTANAVLTANLAVEVRTLLNIVVARVALSTDLVAADCTMTVP